MEKRLPFQEQLKQDRKRRNWSQADLAERVEVDVKTVSRWENEDRIPQPYHRQKLCELFGKTPEEFGLIEVSSSEQATSPLVAATEPAVSFGQTADLSETPSPFTAVAEMETPEREVETNAHTPQTDWGEAPSIGSFFGRAEDLEKLKQWIGNEHCRLVAVLGIGGVGKTTFSRVLAEQIKERFEYVFWRSLHNAPPLEQILQQCIQFVSGQREIDLPRSVDEKIELLMRYLRNQPCLLVLDNVESILQGGERTGQYLQGNENYGRLLQRIGEVEHQSCLLITSREKPKEIARQESSHSPVRSNQLSGIEASEVQELLKDKGLTGEGEIWGELTDQYSGNPLALNLVAEPIKGIFGGNIAKFLAAGETAFGDVNGLLDEQFRRLSTQEQTILYWLAVEREAVPLKNIYENFARPISMGTFLEALTFLQRRSLIETRDSEQFTLQPVIMEYMTKKLIEQAYEEFLEDAGVTTEIWTNYTFMKAQAKDYVRESQVRLILTPIAQQLLNVLGKDGVGKKLRSLLAELHTSYPQQPGYTAGNLLNLLVHLGYDLQGYDFSHLVVRQAYLQGVALPDVNFAHADLTRSVFSDTFGSILAVAVSPNGELLAVGTANDEIRLWDAASGVPLRTYRGHTDWVRSVAFSPDGKTIVSGSEDQTVRLWDVPSGHCLKTLQGHTDWVRSVAFSPDGKTIVSGSEDQTIWLWNVTSGWCLKTLQGHTDGIRSVAFSPDGTMLASGSEDQTIRLWDVISGQYLKTLQGHTDGIRSLAFSLDGTMLVSGSDDQTIRLWDVASGQCLKTLVGHTDRIRSVAFGPQGNTIVSGSADYTARVWDVVSGQCLKVLQGHLHRVYSVVFSSDGNTIVSGSDDQTIRFWDVASGQCLKTLRGYSSGIWSLAFSPDGTMLVSGSDDRAVRLWDVASGQCLKTLQGHSNRVRSVTFNSTGNTIISGSDDQTIRLWDVVSGRYLKSLQGHDNGIWSLAFSPDGTTLASGSEDQTIRLWNMASSQCLKTLQEHNNRVRSVAFSPDGITLASGSDDHTVRLWDVASGQCLKTLQGHKNQVHCLAFSTDGTTLASGSNDQTIRLWDVISGQCLGVIEGYTNQVYAVVFSSLIGVLVSGDHDGMIKFWDVASGQCLKTLQGHKNQVHCLAFSTDGTLLASGGEDQTIRLWDTISSQCLKILRNDRPYERMNITDARGLTVVQKSILMALGAIEG